MRAFKGKELTMNSSFSMPVNLETHRFIKGTLVRSSAGQVILETSKGNFPVKIEGSDAPFDQEIIFRLIHEEPGLLVLSPYHVESLFETLPFLKNLFFTDEEAGMKLLQAVVKEGLPLTREVFCDLKKWLLTAEKVWGVKIHPQAFTFLMAKGIPITPKSVLWALYTLFPSIQKELWRMAASSEKLLPLLTEGRKENFETKQNLSLQDAAGDSALFKKELLDLFTLLPKHFRDKSSSLHSSDSLVDRLFKDAVKFLEVEARSDQSLPHVLLYLFNEDKPLVRWEGRGSSPAGLENNNNFSFRFHFKSALLGKIQVIGVNNKSGLNLMITVERLLSPNYFQDLKPFLENKGWRIIGVHVQQYNEVKSKGSSLPLRVDGWL